MAEATNGIQQMAVMMLNPQFAAQQQKFALQQAMAQQMMQQGSEEPPTNQLANPGGMVVQNSPWAALSRAVEKGVGAYSAQKAIGDQLALATQMQQNKGPQDPNAPTDEEGLKALAYGDKLATAGYENRTAGNKKALEQAQTPVNMNGHMTFMTPPALQNSPQTASQAPVAASNLPMPPAPSIDAPANMDEVLNQYSTTHQGAPASVVSGKSSVPIDFNNPASVKGAEAEAVKYGETAADTAKNLDAMTSKLPLVLSRLDTMRKAAPDSSFGYGVDNQGEGAKQDLHDQLGDKTSKANNTLLQQSAQGVLPELGPQLQGMKGNKFLESLAASSSGLNMKAPTEAKLSLINGLQKNYIGMIKSTAQQLRDMGQKAPSDAEIDAIVSAQSPQVVQQGVTHIWTPNGIKPVGAK